MVADTNGDQRLMRSLGSVRYLKLEETNHIHFSFQFYDNRRIVICEKYDDENKQTGFDKLYSIKVHEPTLRELLLLQSIAF